MCLSDLLGLVLSRVLACGQRKLQGRGPKGKVGGWGREGQGQCGSKRKERLGEGQKLVVEMELGVCDGDWLAGHQTHFFFL